MEQAFADMIDQLAEEGASAPKRMKTDGPPNGQSFATQSLAQQASTVPGTARRATEVPGPARGV